MGASAVIGRFVVSSLIILLVLAGLVLVFLGSGFGIFWSLSWNPPTGRFITSMLLALRMVILELAGRGALEGVVFPAARWWYTRAMYWGLGVSTIGIYFISLLFPEYPEKLDYVAILAIIAISGWWKALTTVVARGVLCVDCRLLASQNVGYPEECENGCRNGYCSCNQIGNQTDSSLAAPGDKLGRPFGFFEDRC